MKPARSFQASSKPTNRTGKSSREPQEKVRRRAFELYEQRGRIDGYDIDDWLQAEVELIPTKAKKTV